MYGAKNQAPLAVGIKIVAPNDKMGQQFQQDLEDRLNPGGVTPAKPAYQLTVDLISAPTAIGVARDGTVSRYNVILQSNYTLTNLADETERRGTVRHVSSYNNPANQFFSTYISEQDAISRGITELAELYRQRLGALLLKKPAS